MSAYGPVSLIPLSDWSFDEAVVIMEAYCVDADIKIFLGVNAVLYQTCS